MKNTPLPTLTTEWVPIASIVFDPTVNTRPTDPRAVSRIATKLDLDALGYPVLSLRPNGTYVVLDGMHRISALREVGWLNGQMVECRVHRDLTHERECELFGDLNTQKPMAAAAKMLANIGARRSPDYEINEIVESVGLQFRHYKRDGFIAAPDALRRVYMGARVNNAGGGEPNPELLRSTLRLLLAAWGKSKDAVRADMLCGTGLFLARFGNEIEIGSLVERLALVPAGPLKIVADGRSLANLHNSKLEAGIAAKLVFVYNERRRSRKLPDWWAS